MLPREIATDDVPPEDNVKCLLLPNKSVNPHRAQYIYLYIDQSVYVYVCMCVITSYVEIY